MNLVVGGGLVGGFGGAEHLLHLLHLKNLFLGGVIRDPGAFLLVGSVEETFSTLHGLDVEVGNVRLAVRKLEADLAVGGQHQVVLGQTSLAVKDGHDALLHCHLALVEAPRGGIVLSVLATAGLGNQGNATAGMGQAARLGDTVHEGQALLG